MWTEAQLHAVLARGGCQLAQPYDGLLPMPIPITEKAFMAAVMKLATQHQWKVYHPFDSRKSAPGYPDLTMAKPGQPVIFAELKVGTEKPTIEQQAWLDTLSQAQNTQVFLWRPDDWSMIQEVLSHA